MVRFTFVGNLHSLHGGIAILFLTLLAVRADQPPLPHIPHVAALHILGQPGAPANLEELRLDDLEDAAGILRWDWGMEISPGKKLVFHLHGGDSGSNPPRVDNFIYEVIGPLAASFGNRISLVRQVMNQNQAEQLSLQIRTHQLDHPSLWVGINPTIQIAVDPAWSGERGSSGSIDIPSTIWEQHFGPPNAPHRLSYQLDVAVVPAVPTDIPGQIVSK